MKKNPRKKKINELIDKKKEELEALNPKSCSCFIRHLDCGSCNACEVELNALANPIYDSAQWGIHFEASPRHADVLALTGPYVRSLDQAARSTLEAMPIKRIITIGDCAKDAGVFKNSYATLPYPDEVKEAIIDFAHIPGCPPSPEDILRTLFKMAT